MNKKKIIIISIVVLLILIIAILLLVSYLNSKPKKDVLFEAYEETVDYPISYKKDKNGNLEVRIDGSKTPELSWDARIQDEEYIDVAIQGKESKGKATYIISPKAAGITRVDFVRTRDLSGISVDVVCISLEIYVGEAAEGYTINCLDPHYVKGNEVIGENTDYPVLLNNSSYIDGSDIYEHGYDNPLNGDIIFVNGQNDWVLESADQYADFMYFSEDGKDFVCILKGSGPIELDPKYGTPTDSTEVEAATVTSANSVTSTEISLSSESLGITKNIQVTFNDDETVTLSLINEK